jgi:hypothetical protein
VGNRKKNDGMSTVDAKHAKHVCLIVCKDCGPAKLRGSSSIVARFGRDGAHAMPLRHVKIAARLLGYHLDFDAPVTIHPVKIYHLGFIFVLLHFSPAGKF